MSSRRSTITRREFTAAIGARAPSFATPSEGRPLAMTRVQASQPTAGGPIGPLSPQVLPAGILLIHGFPELADSWVLRHGSRPGHGRTGRRRHAHVSGDRGPRLLDGAGHWVQQEQAPALATLLIDFLRVEKLR